MKREDFAPGDTVVVIGGPFRTHTGIVISSDGDRVLVRISVFGRILENVPINRLDLKKKPSAASSD
jgi:transcription antitermination factor NusG